jgi:hypothetical protein
MLREVFEPEGVQNMMAKLHNKNLRKFYSSPNFISVLKLGRMRGAGHVTLMGETEKFKKLFVGKLQEKTTWKTKNR